MKTKIAQYFRVIAATVILLAPPVMATALEPESPSSVDGAPMVALQAFDNAIPSCTGGETVLLLQDGLPWFNSNEQELTAQNKNFCVASSSELGTLDLGQFTEILLSAAQPQQFYDNLFPNGSVHAAISTFVQNGGILSANLTDAAWSAGYWSGKTFVGGLTHTVSYNSYLNISTPAHPIISDSLPCPSGNCGPILDNGYRTDLDGWTYSTHGYFTNLPPGSVTILSDSANLPVMIEYPFGAGQVIATLTTTEYMYNYGNRKLLANEIAYQDYLVTSSVQAPAVGKSASPATINLSGSGGTEEATVTLSVTGAGGTETTITSMDIVFALDSSGSMGWNDPSGLRKTAAKTFVDKMVSARDTAGVVSWDENIDFTFPLSDDFPTVKAQIDNVDDSGGTNLEAGLSQAIALLDADKRPGTKTIIVFLSNGEGSYTGAATAAAKAKRYQVYTIGLGPNPATAYLTHMATQTGGQYYASPTADNLQAIFDAIYTEVTTSTVPYNVNVVEVTQSYIVDEGEFNVPPDSVTTDGAGITTIVWNNVGLLSGDGDPDLSADETVQLSFKAKSELSGTQLPIDVFGAARVSYTNRDGTIFRSVAIPQATINVNAPPQADAGGPYTANEGAIVTLSASGSSDPDDAIATYAWDLDNDGIYESSGVSVDMMYGDNGTFTVGLQVADTFGAISTATTSVTWNNVAPTVSALAAPAIVAVNTAFSVSATIGDPGTADTHTAECSFGDGGASHIGDVDQPNDKVKASSADAFHIDYTQPGVYTVTMMVTDDDGATGQAEATVVAYDPSAGFVTGGGWIDSPAGAYKIDASLAGRANFGFVSKYQKGATKPTGQTEFNFQTAGLNFHSSSYDWLVVTGGNAAQYKGTGTINGSGAYRFMLWAGDGMTDTFRIRIWTEDGAGTETDVYDNASNQPISGGTIVIHTGKTGK